MLVSRWGILWKPLHFSLAQNIKVIEMTMLRHKFCVRGSDETVVVLVDEEEFE